MTTLDGVLFFPITPFGRDGSLDLCALREHLEQGLAAGPGGVFVACGTGEFHALSPAEHRQVVETAVQVTGGLIPVYVGTGGPLPLAVELARSAEECGADGLLLLPPYLANAPAAGLVAYTREVAAASDLPLIVYNRGTARYDPAAAVAVSQIPIVTGFKDGIGDLDLLSRIVLAVRDALDGSGKPFQFFNGMPTAEVTVPAYRGIGVALYSSAVFCFAPEISLAFYEAVAEGNTALADRFLAEFFHPLVALRDEVPGYAVSLVKAAVTLRGLDVGGVRAPLLDPEPAHLARLGAILEAGLALTTTRSAA
ncbi:5-dehydro-4-deoxyglucarate dehydratase [Streptomyces sp. NPDC056352]|uniref:5-dehydro-4-deoxyglucarate dehydratase n=1 Tax=Streptomyces sp. NPDC056352 TaxID=3345791 RepID=UPI0035E3432D